MTLSVPSLPPSAHDDDDRLDLFSNLQLRQPLPQVLAPAQQQQQQGSYDNNSNGLYLPSMNAMDSSTAPGFDHHDYQQQAVPTNVLRVSREVENIGARVPMSKKRVSWRFVIAGAETVHTVTLEHSRISAKKRLRLDGRRLFNSEQYCAGDWKYDFRVEHHVPRFTVVIKDVKATVVDQHSLSGIYQLHVDGHAWDELPERVFAGAVKSRISDPVWSSDKFARRVSDDEFDLQRNNQQPGTGHAWVFAFGVLGTIHKLELWDLEQGKFVVVLDCRELARVKHDDIEQDTWEYEYTLANQHELVLTVTLDEGDGSKRYGFAIDGSPWKDMSETDFVLQPGWFPVYSRSKGTAYFRNLATNETRWEKPIMSRNGSTIIEQIPSQDLKPTVSPVHKHMDLPHASFSSNQLEFQHSPSQPAPLVFQEQQEQQENEVNLLDFSEISVHSSPKHAPLPVTSAEFAAFDPFDPVYQAAVARPSQPPAQYQQQPPRQAPLDFLS
ncbi:Ww domain [Globisporangium polare]